MSNFYFQEGNVVILRPFGAMLDRRGKIIGSVTKVAEATDWSNGRIRVWVNWGNNLFSNEWEGDLKRIDVIDALAKLDA